MRLSGRAVVVAGCALTWGAVAGWLVPAHVGGVRASSRADRDAGAAVFHEKGCEHCHGVDGVGGERGPSLAGIGRKWKPEQIRMQIVAGGGGMPEFGDVLGPDEISRLVDYLAAKRSKVKPSKSVPQNAPPKKPDAGGSDDQG